ncbi:putative Plasmid stabilization system [Candidatus Sulfopaludibacter sp. SbA4]|nr:putative Plasmid stabilization system [Candidatus Sulfopaludibacter sp. SbA4]
MGWTLRIARRVEKALQKLPARDREVLAAAVQSLAENPFSGDIVRLKGSLVWRRRVGNYRIFFEVHLDTRVVDVEDLRRRTSTTY